MSKTSHLFSQPENKHFIKSDSDFLDECNKRGIAVDNDFLIECQNQNLLNPIREFDEKREYPGETISIKTRYYDLFQILLVSEIYRRIKIFSDIRGKAAEIKNALSSYEKILPLLYDIRYFYQDEIYNYLSGGIAPPFKLSGEQLLKFNLDLLGLFKELKNDFKASDYLKKHKISKVELRDLRDKFYIDGCQDDPMNKWYPFLRTIRRVDRNKFKDVMGSVLLAHNYYIFAELLTYFYRDAFDDEIIDPESIFDLTGGKWRKRECEGCGKTIKIKNFDERFCFKCKKKAIETKEAKFVCANKKCGRPLLKFADGDEIINSIFVHTKKNREGSLTMITDTKLDYGRLTIYIPCECGKLNIFSIDKGWF
jgi:hypothetical protein